MRTRHSLLATALGTIGFATACGTPKVEDGATFTETSFVSLWRNDALQRVDLLFVVDNSPSMADKLPLLREGIAALVRRTVGPPCQRDFYYTGPHFPHWSAEPDEWGYCPEGYTHWPLDVSVRVGFITSSLGSWVPGICEDSPEQNDRAHLLPTVRRDLPKDDPRGFLQWSTWDTDRALDQFLDDVRAQVDGIGHDGCGHEAPLQASYRFLTDPEPALLRSLDPKTGHWRPVTDEDGAPLLDEELLAQRRAFLRDDSMMRVIVISDEDDCSLAPDALDWRQVPVPTAPAAFECSDLISVVDSDPRHPLDRYTWPDGNWLEFGYTLITGAPTHLLEADHRWSRWSEVPADNPEWKALKWSSLANPEAPVCSFVSAEYGSFSANGASRFYELAERGAGLASICPSSTEGSIDDPNFAWNHQLDMMPFYAGCYPTEGFCVPQPLSSDPETLHCRLAEISIPDPEGRPFDCTAEGRFPADPELEARTLDRLRETYGCSGSDACWFEGATVCEVTELEADAEEECRTSKHPTVSGFCTLPVTGNHDEPVSCIGGSEVGVRLVTPPRVRAIGRNTTMFAFCSQASE